MFTGTLYPARNIEGFGQWDDTAKRNGVTVEVRREASPLRGKANRYRYSVIVGNLFEAHKVYQVDDPNGCEGVFDFLSEHFEGGNHFTTE